MTEFAVFPGNCPRNVNKDAKYAVRTVKGRAVIALRYLSANGEEWLATTRRHPDLVDIVNEVKTTMGEAPNGPFYINEYRQVIVPVADGNYYYAGDYEARLRFEFEGKTLSGEAVDLRGRRLSPGDTWDGPHPGIPYILKAGGGDVFYRAQPRPNVTKKTMLSSEVGPDAARAFANRVMGVKGFEGGRFYINEWSELFAPVAEEYELTYIYIGHLDNDEPWYPKPSVPNTAA